MAQPKKTNIKNEVKKELKTITDTVDIEELNQILANNPANKVQISRKTLENIAKWALNGQSEQEIRSNLELSLSEWKFLLDNCPTILIVMQHSTAYADMVVSGTLLQTAIGGHAIKRKTYVKVKEYNDEGKTIGEHVEIVEYEEIAQPNPYLLKYLAENKLNEKFGDRKVDEGKRFDKIIDALTEEEVKAIKENKDERRI